MKKGYFLEKYISANEEEKRILEADFSYAVRELIERGIKIRHILSKKRLEAIAKEASSSNKKTQTKKLITEILQKEHSSLMKDIGVYILPYLSKGNNE